MATQPRAPMKKPSARKYSYHPGLSKAINTSPNTPTVRAASAKHAANLTYAHVYVKSGRNGGACRCK